MGERIEPRVGMKVRCVRRSKLFGGWFDGIGTVLSIDGGGFASGTIVVSVLEETPHSQCFDRSEWEAGDIVPVKDDAVAITGENGGLAIPNQPVHISGLGMASFSPPIGNPGDEVRVITEPSTVSTYLLVNGGWACVSVTRQTPVSRLARVLFNELMSLEASHYGELEDQPGGGERLQMVLQKMWDSTMPDERKACEERAEYLLAEMDKLP